MEELNEEIAQFFHLTDSFETSWITKTEESFLKFERFLKKTPVSVESNNVIGQSVKRPKHTFIGADSAEKKRFEIEIKQIASDELKVSSEEQYRIGNEICIQPQLLLQRPQRAAKTKIINCFKEIPLSSKLRKPSDPKVEEKVLLNVKEERNMNSILLALKTKDVSICDLPEGVKWKSDEESRISDEQTKTEKNDKSLEIVQPKDIVIVLSDDEFQKMPPPVTIPKIRPQRTKKEVAKIFNSPQEKLTIVKTEKPSINYKQSLDKKKTISEEKILKEEKISEMTPTTQSVNLTFTKRGRNKRIPVKPIVGIKKEIEIEDGFIEEKTSAKVSVRIGNISNVKSLANVEDKSLESFYEDAIDETNKDIFHFLHFDKEAVVKVARLKSQDNNAIIKNDNSDTTFVYSNDGSITAKRSERNATFVFENNQEKEIAAANNLDPFKQTIDVREKNVDATFNIVEPVENNSIEIGEGKNLMENEYSEKFKKQKEMRVPHAESIQVQAKKNQIFNPFVPSPMKTKIEAYEKHTENIKIISPPQRSRAKEKKENVEPRKRFVTPTTTTVITKFLTPTQLNRTPFNEVKKLTCSSKKKHLVKTSSKSVNTRRGTASRNNSSEDTRGGGDNQALLEEKKKTRDLKRQQVAKNREELVRQKLERVHKVIQEKGSKIRVIEDGKKARQQKPFLEKQFKKLKTSIENLCQEQPRSVSSKSQGNGNILGDPNVSKKVHKQLQIYQQQKMQTPENLIFKPKLYYDFEMLNTDDSTDDESKPSNKRPPIPVWSRSHDRKTGIGKQNDLAKYIVDCFFSVQPMTPNLREIFPAIDPSCLKRNSSAYWKTPPRYSEMPKY